MDNASSYQSQRADQTSYEFAPQFTFNVWESPSSSALFRPSFHQNHVAVHPHVRSRVAFGRSAALQSNFDFVDQCSNDPTEPESDWPNNTSAFQSLVPTQFDFGTKAVPTRSDRDTINRFVRDRGPWHASNIVPTTPATSTGPYYSYQVNSDYYSSYQPGPGSELESTGYCPSDSAYYTAPLGAPSVKSGSVNEFSPDLSLEVPLADLTMASIPEGPSSNSTDDEQEDVIEVAQSTKSKPKPTRGGKRICDRCSPPKLLKCPSDYKKHMLIHDKPHKCDYPGCNRTEGFGTINDLNRHKSSVHKVRSGKSFKCAAPGCKAGDKVWPRYDNFKQHIERMHKGVDVNDIIEKSRARADAVETENNNTIERDLDGVGAGAGSGVPMLATIAPEDLQADHVTSSYNGSLHTRYPHGRQNGQVAQQTKDVPTHGDTTGLHILSNLAEVHSDLRPRQTQNHRRVLAAVESVVQKCLLENQASGSNDEINGLRKIQAVLDEITNNQSYTSSMGSSDGENPENKPARIQCTFDKCKKSFKRQCELNKHMKRHRKPYVCTAVSCNHRCGSKFDWQRHEASCNLRGREFLDANEAIHVCLEPDNSRPTGKCGFVHTSQKFFEDHLRDSHAIKDDAKLRDYMLRSQLPTKQPGVGWCGFCLRSVQWSATAASGDARNFQTGYGKHGDRADHIDWHVSREGRNMDEYVSLEYHLSKADATPDKLQSWFQNEGSTRAGNADPRIQNPDYVEANQRKRKRAESGGSDDEHRKKLNEAKWACCSCGQYYLYKMYPSCMGCDHRRCDACEDINTKRYSMKTPWDANKKYALNAY